MYGLKTQDCFLQQHDFITTTKMKLLHLVFFLIFIGIGSYFLWNMAPLISHICQHGFESLASVKSGAMKKAVVVYSLLILALVVNMINCNLFLLASNTTQKSLSVLFSFVLLPYEIFFFSSTYLTSRINA